MLLNSKAKVSFSRDSKSFMGVKMNKHITSKGKNAHTITIK